jgi:hypothetical protein
MSRAGSTVRSARPTSDTTNNIAIKGLAKEIERAKEFSQEAIEQINKLTAQLKRLQDKPLKLAPLEKFNGTRSKLQEFLAAASIHLDVNASKLTNKTSKVSFVAAHFTRRAID